MAGLLLFCDPASGIEWETLFAIAPQYRLFLDTPEYLGQSGSGPSLALRAKVQGLWNDGEDIFTFIPFYRCDGQDKNRTHGDIRQASWTKVGEGWQLLLGIGKVFWGVTESQHLVDVINQTDLVENPNGEEKLGQPMLDLTFLKDWGTLDVFVLYGFRERTFPGSAGRLRGGVPVDKTLAVVEDGSWDIDLATRWSHTIGDWDLALSHFSGTSREPTLTLAESSMGEAVLQPVYPSINQSGLEVQVTKGAWLWKLEAIRRLGGDQDHSASVFGFEYTYYGMLDTVADLGLLAEYHYDTRGRDATTGLANDLFLGLRWMANDVADTNILLGGMFGMDDDGNFYTLEGSRRFGNNIKLSIDGKYYTRPATQDVFYDWRADSYVQVELKFFF